MLVAKNLLRTCHLPHVVRHVHKNVADHIARCSAPSVPARSFVSLCSLYCCCPFVSLLALRILYFFKTKCLYLLILFFVFLFFLCGALLLRSTCLCIAAHTSTTISTCSCFVRFYNLRTLPPIRCMSLHHTTSTSTTSSTCSCSVRSNNV